MLEKQIFIGGETFTIADVYHLPSMMLLAKIGESDHLWKGLSNVERWYKEISTRDSSLRLSSEIVHADPEAIYTGSATGILNSIDIPAAA